MVEKHEPSRTPLKILTLDGGGLQAISTLLILNRVLENIAIQNGTPHSKPRPCDVFDTIAGIGAGGWLAILLSRFHMDVTSCLTKLYNLIRRITPKSKSEQLRLRLFQHSYFDKDRFLDQVDHLTSLYNIGDLLYENDPEGARTCHVIVASLKSDATGYNLLRTYEIPESAQKPERMLEGPQFPSYFKVSDAFGATSAARYFSPRSDPHNITELALDELWAIYGKDVPLAVVLNIGPSSPQGVDVNQIASKVFFGLHSASRKDIRLCQRGQILQEYEVLEEGVRHQCQLNLRARFEEATFPIRTLEQLHV